MMNVFYLSPVNVRIIVSILFLFSANGIVSLREFGRYIDAR